MSHRFLDPEGMAPAVGFSHGVEARPGRLVFVAGQTGSGQGLVEQFAGACSNVAKVLAEADAKTEHLVSVTIFTTDLGAYRDSMQELGEAWRAVFGRHYPAVALIGVSELFEPEALVEVVATAVVP